MKTRPFHSLQKRYPLILFILFYLGWSLLTFHHFGATYDESGVYTRGIVLLHSIAHGDWDRLSHRLAPDDGLVVYDHFNSLILYLFNPDCDIDTYHLLNLFFALIVFIALFEVLLWQYSKPWLAALGPLFLFLTPRFTGDIPANPKDIPFAVFYYLALVAILYFHRHGKTNAAIKCLVLGILFGLAQCSRLLGFTLYIVYILFDLHFYYHQTRRHTLAKIRDRAMKLLAPLAAIFIASNLLMAATWPYLRADYFKNLMEMLMLSKNFTWNNPVLFMGKEILSTQLPLSYLPVWFFISTPLFILFFLGGALFFISDKVKNELLILLGSALGVNLALYVCLRPVVYDGIRHFLFFLPILATLAAMSAIEFWRKSKHPLLKKMSVGFAVFNMLLVSLHMVSLHPYEYVYFNEFIGDLKGATGQFETDYWGASMKEAVEWLGRNEIKDPSKTYKIAGNCNSYQLLFYASPNMVWTEDRKDADYYLATTRDDRYQTVNPFRAVHVVAREGVPLSYVFKLR